MVYRDDPNTPVGDSGGVELSPSYHDDPIHASDDMEYGIPSPPPPRSSGGLFCKGFLAAFLLLLALVFGGYEYYEYSQGEADVPSSGTSVGTGKGPGGKQGMFPKKTKVGVRGKGGDDGPAGGAVEEPEKPVHSYEPPAAPVSGFADGEPAKPKPAPKEAEVVVETPSEPEPEPEPAVTPGPTNQPTPMPTNKPVTPKPTITKTTHLPEPSDECIDDEKFVTSALKKCVNFVANVGRIPLHQARCSQGTGIVDNSGDELLVKHFCRKSCGLCGDSKWALMEKQKQADTNEYAVQLGDKEEEKEKEEEEEEFAKEFEEVVEMEEEKEEMIEEGIIEEVVQGNGATGGAEISGEVQEEDATLWEELKEEEDGDECVDDPTFTFWNGKTCLNFVANVDDAALLETRCSKGRGKGEELWFLKDHCRKSCGVCEGGPSPSMPAVAEPTPEESAAEEPVTVEPDDEAEESVSEGKSHEPPAVDNSIPRPGDSGLPDYYVPLTALERDAMKERLRETLRTTKQSVLMASTLPDLPQEFRDNMLVPWQRTLVLGPDTPRQFVHLGNKQAGGESVDELISCAIGRQNEVLKELGKEEVGYSAISEANHNLEACKSELASNIGASIVGGQFVYNDQDGKPIPGAAFDPANPKLKIPDKDMNACGAGESGVMTFNAPLGAVRSFGWGNADSIMMIANPVMRVHSMYQLMAKQCYQCRELKDILKEIADGTFEDDGDGLCTSQMIGHQGASLLTRPDLVTLAATDPNSPVERQIVENAVRNLRESVTWIGIMDNMDASVSGFKEVFPWLSDSLSGRAMALQQEFAKRGDKIGSDANLGLPEGYIDKTMCPFKDSNRASYSCGTKQVDEETLMWIRRLNTRDLAVYRAALERFSIQQEVLEEYRQALHLDG